MLHWIGDLEAATEKIKDDEEINLRNSFSLLIHLLVSFLCSLIIIWLINFHTIFDLRVFEWRNSLRLINKWMPFHLFRDNSSSSCYD